MSVQVVLGVHRGRRLRHVHQGAERMRVGRAVECNLERDSIGLTLACTQEQLLGPDTDISWAYLNGDMRDLKPNEFVLDFLGELVFQFAKVFVLAHRE